MALSVEFESVLRELFKRRVAWLRHANGKKRPGPAPAFTRNKVNPVLDRRRLAQSEALRCATSWVAEGFPMESISILALGQVGTGRSQDRALAVDNQSGSP